MLLLLLSTYSIYCSLHLQEIGAVALVTHVDSSMKEEEQKLEEGMEEPKVCHVYW